MNYFVVIGDIIRSRSVPNRYELQESFAMTLREVQHNYGDQITSPLTLTIGDEFQAIISIANGLFKMMYEIELQLKNVELRYGLGIGEIYTPINKISSIGMDGPAFHLAREAVEEARREGIRYKFKHKGELAEKRINTLFRWMDVTTRKWNKQRKAILQYYQEEYTQQEIARWVQISQPAVSKNINDPYFKLVDQTQRLIIKELNHILQTGNDGK